MAGTHRQAGVGRSHLSPSRRGALGRSAALSCLASAAVLVAACGSSGGNTATPGADGNGARTGTAAGAKSAVSARQLSGIGSALVTSSGLTIYTPKTPAERNGDIKCTRSCLSFWFPVIATSASPGSTGLPGKLSTIHRPDGQVQLTYDGRPLYTFRLDTAAGQAHGNNFHDSFNGTDFTWEVVTPSGKPAGTGSPAASPSYSYQAGY